MPQHNDPETLKIPAYMRKRAIVSASKQNLILTALDRKEAVALRKKETAQRKTTGERYATTSRTPTRRALSRTPLHHPSPLPAPSALSHSTPPELPAKLPSIGTVTHYLDNIGVAIIKLTAPLKLGAMIIMESGNASTSQQDSFLFTQTVEEMQIDRQPVKKAKKDAHIGLKADHPVKVESHVWLLTK